MLDNCEHVIGAAAELCGELLRACDDLRILATSREALRIAGESAYRLTPLPLPLPVPVPDGGRTRPAQRRWRYLPTGPGRLTRGSR